MKEAMMEIMKVLVNVVIPLAAFTVGLQTPKGQGLWLWKRTGLLLRSLLAILVLVPVATVLLLQLVPLSGMIEAGIVVAILAIGMGPIAVLKRSHTGESLRGYQLGLNVSLVLLSIVFVPAAVAVHGALFQHNVHLGVGKVAALVLTRQLLPLLAGLLVARLLPRPALALGRYANAVVNVGTLLIVVIALLAVWRQLAVPGLAGWLAAAAVALVAIVIGHLLGGPERDTRGVLGAFSAMRFPALALLLASSAPRGPQLVPEVLVYVIASSVLVALYGAVLARRAKRPAPSAPRLELASPGRA